MRVELLRWIRAHRDPGSHDTETEIAKQTTELAPASDGINDLRDEYEKSLTMLQLIAAFVLVIACANLANLMLVRGVARRQELSVRSALGASRSRLVREMLVESITLAIFGGALGLFVAYAGVKAILAIVMKGVTIDPLSASPSSARSALRPRRLRHHRRALRHRSCAHGLTSQPRRSPARSQSHHRQYQRTSARSRHPPGRTLRCSAQHLRPAHRSAFSVFSIRTSASRPTAASSPSSIFRPQAYRYDQLDNLYRQFDQAFAAEHNLHDAAWATYSPMAYNNWGTG